jgi:hypothetical protein
MTNYLREDAITVFVGDATNSAISARQVPLPSGFAFANGGHTSAKIELAVLLEQPEHVIGVRSTPNARERLPDPGAERRWLLLITSVHAPPKRTHLLPSPNLLDIRRFISFAANSTRPAPVAKKQSSLEAA